METEVGDLTVKYGKDDHTISGLSSTQTVKDLKEAIYEKTHVQPTRQKLLGLKIKRKQT